MSILQFSLSSSKTLSFTQLPIPFTPTNLSSRSLPTPIRMGGGPRTYPGGVSKWQWKRMQAKKAKQLLQARLSRERQIYEMRKRAELKAAVSELERPWETVEKPPNLFSVGADDQLKVLADRFQKPGGLDLWSERDGPELFRQDNNGLNSARFFPKGVVHSVKPYGKVAELCSGIESLELKEETNLRRKGYSEKVMKKNLDGGNVVGENKNVGKGSRRTDSEPKRVESRNNNGMVRDGKSMMKDIRRKQLGDSEQKRSGYDGRSQRREYKTRDSENGVKRDSQVLDMSLQNDGRYGL